MRPGGSETGQKDISIVGISMLNPHFTPENIALAAADAQRHAREVCFMLPDLPAEHTLAGYGYLPDEARKSARRKFRTLEKHCRAAMAGALSGTGRVVRWGEFHSRPEYTAMLAHMNTLYANNAAFGEDVRGVTASVYAESAYPMKRPMTPAEQVEAGRHFLLQELAFILGSPVILGVETTEYAYHRDMPILDRLVAGGYAGHLATPAVSFRKIEAHGAA
jgi:tRNA-dependent cyclodipeptide synthase